MKKILLSALSVLTISTMNAQVPKKPLVEHFTQASCGPCASQNPQMYTTLGNFGSANYCKVTYQTSWPGVDPMNAAYPTGPSTRVTYYNVSGVPDCSLNGGATNAPNTVVTAATLNNAATLTTPYQLNVTQTWNSASSLDVRISIVNVTGAAISSADRVHIAMVEDHVSYPAAPGSNGETDFYYVLRQFYSVTGTPVNVGSTLGSIPANDSLVYTFNLTNVPSYVRDLSQISFVVFLQNNASKVVHQSAKSTPSTPPGVLSASAANAATAGAGYCNYTFNPAVTFTNNGTTPITTVTAEYTINNGTPVSQTFTGNLTQGQNTTITFPAATLTPGTSNVQFTITDMNNGGGAVSPAALEMPLLIYNKLNATGMPAPVVEGFENSTLIPTTGYSRTLPNAIFDAPAAITEANFSIVDGPTYNYTNFGGMAASNRAIRFRFFSIQSGVMSVVFQKINTGSGTTLTFNHAYRQYQNENDRLQVEVSTNCGSTWTSVWNQAGAALATQPASQTAWNNVTSAAHWRANSVDLSAYDNMNDVIIRFKGTSAYGNNLFLDDINLSVVSNVTTVAQEAAEVRIMPNPVSDRMAVEFTMLNTSEASMNIVNALGQQVQQVTNGTFTGTNVVEVNTSNLVSGVYFLNITSDAGTTTKRFVVEK